MVEINTQYPIYALLFMGDGEQLWSAGEEEVFRRWRVKDGREVGEPLPAGAEIYAASLSPDRKWLVFGLGCLNSNVWAWNTQTDQSPLVMKGHTNTVFSVDISPDSTRVATGSGDNCAFVWDIKTGADLVGPLQHEDVVVTVRFSPKGDRIATATARNGRETRSIRVYNSATGQQLWNVPFLVDKFISSPFVWLPDSSRLLAVSYGKVTSFDASPGFSIRQWSAPGKGESGSIVLSHNKRFVAVAAFRTLSFWAILTYEQIGPVIEFASDIWSVVLSPNDDYIAIGEKNGKITLRRLDEILHPSWISSNQPGNSHSSNTRPSLSSSYLPGPPSMTTNYHSPIIQDHNILFQGIGGEATRSIGAQHVTSTYDVTPAVDLVRPLGYFGQHSNRQIASGVVPKHTIQGNRDKAMDTNTRVQFPVAPEVTAGRLTRQTSHRGVSLSQLPTLRNAIQRVGKASPLVLIDVESGRLCDEQERSDLFESQLQLEGHIHSSVEEYFRYVTLSHVWAGKRLEPSFQAVERAGSVWKLDASPHNNKLQEFCKEVRSKGYRWAWCDTCCIDKDRSAVLEKSLKMMYKWYEASAATFVHLADVGSVHGNLKDSHWLTRAWTSQELLAPKVVRFYSRDWKPYRNDTRFNHKESPEIMQELANAMGIGCESIVAFSPDRLGIREKLRLASGRHATEVEDIAYSLIGIFKSDIHPSYGDGDTALGRLLEEIVTRQGDVTVLAWSGKASSFNSCLPATLAVYSQLPVASPIIEGVQMDRRIAAMKNQLSQPDVISFYNKVNKLRAVRFDHRRLRLPCILFAVKKLAIQDARTHRYRARVSGIGDVDFCMVDRHSPQSPSSPKLIFVHPWINDLRNLHDGNNDGPAKDTGTAPNSPPQSPGTRMDEYTLALRLVARLRQPFCALLLQQQPGGEFKRIGAEHEIIIPSIAHDINFARDVKVDVVDIL